MSIRFPNSELAPDGWRGRVGIRKRPPQLTESAETDLRPSPSFHCANFNLWLAFQPSIDILAHHIPGQAIALLDQTFKLFASSIDES
jgi:hypothetical protein